LTVLTLGDHTAGSSASFVSPMGDLVITAAVATHRSSFVSRALLVLLALVLALTTLTIVASAPVQAAPAPAVVTAKIDFAPTGAGAAGWTLDTGAAYTDAAGSGWVREDSLAGSHVPLDLPLNTRNRGSGTNACATTVGTTQGRTFIHMQAPTTNATNNSTKGAWEYALPNGQYKVEVGYGDAHLGGDAESHTLNVEGVNLVKNDIGSFAASCSASRMRKATTWATVTDGKLTVDAVGGTNTKLAWVTIDSVPVAGLTATIPSATSIALDWADVDGATSYKVWRTEALPSPAGDDAVPTTVTEGLTSSEFTDTGAVKGVLYYYSVGLAGTAAAVNGCTTADASPEGRLQGTRRFPRSRLRGGRGPWLQQHAGLRLDPARVPDPHQPRRQRS
jgi:hypothetical protein